MERRTISMRRGLVRAAALSACLLAANALAPASLAKDRRAKGPVGQHFAALNVAGGVEFRMLLVFPLERASAGPAGKDDSRPRLASHAHELEVGLSSRGAGGARQLQLDNLSGESMVALPGQIVRSERYDLALTHHVTVKPMGGKRLPELAVVSRTDDAEDTRVERTLTPHWLPPTLRWVTSPQSKARDKAGTCRDWAGAAGLVGGRRSMADLGQGPVIAERVDDYVSTLRDVVRVLPGRDVVGYAAYLDDVPLIVETFADADTFRAVWPGLSRALAAEAALAEVAEGLLDGDIPWDALTEAQRAATDAMLRHAETATGHSKNVGSTGHLQTMELDHGTAQCLVVRGSGVVHTQILLSPRERAAIAREVEAELEDDEPYVPGPREVGERERPRLTGDKKREKERVLDRRNVDEDGKAKPPKIPPPPNPLPPPVEIDEPDEPKPPTIRAGKK
jgi:hypothetical protein